jgi:hypothetical protein
MIARVAPILAAGRANPKERIHGGEPSVHSIRSGLVSLISDLRQVRQVIGRPLFAMERKFGMLSTVTLFAILQSF